MSNLSHVAHLAEAGDVGQAVKAAQSALAQVLRERELLHTALDREISALVEQALARIVVQLSAAPTDYQQWVLPRLIEGVRRVLDELAVGAGAKAADGLRQAWALGEQTVDLPLNTLPAAGASTVTAAPAVALSQPDLRTLRAMQSFTTQLIGGATDDAVRFINRALGQVLLGVDTPAQAIRTVAKLLPDRTRMQVRGIVNTNLAQAANSAAFARLKQRAAQDPGVRKQWRRSRKLHSRANHDAAHGQVQEVDKPFTITAANGRGTVEIMFPTDPAAPLAEVMNCGCTMVPWRPGFGTGTLYGKAPPPAPPAKRPVPKKVQPATLTTQQRALQAFAATKGGWTDVTGQRLVINEKLFPAAIAEPALKKKGGADLASHFAVQAVKRPTEVWQHERVDTSTGEIVRQRLFIKRFEAAGQTWIGRAEFRAEGDGPEARWVPAVAYSARPVGSAAHAADVAMSALRAGARVWPRRK